MIGTIDWHHREAPQADAYEFQSEGVVQMFEDLEHRMADDRKDGQDGEMRNKHSYDVMMLKMTNLMDKNKDEQRKDIAAKGKKEQDLADAQGEKVDIPSFIDAI